MPQTTDMTPGSGTRRALKLALVAVMLTAACSSGDDSSGDSDAASVEVRPFAEVQDGDLVFEPDPADPSRAIARVVTTEPMICAFVWGEDESFGRFNNSLAMDGTGIVDHDVVLPDVEPGVEYSYIVQGTTADGTLYRSEVDTFSVDPELPDPDETPTIDVGENLAPGATVAEVSSEFSDSFAAEQAIDDDTGTEWAADGDGDDGFITLDLGADHEIAAIEFVTRSMADGSATTSTYTVTVDGGDTVGAFPAGTPAEPRPTEVELSGRQLRFDIDSSTGGNVGAMEIRVYAPTSG